MIKKPHKGPKILLLDIETAPIIGYLWGIREETLGINQIKLDWHILSWAAKWLHEDKMMYMDQRNAKNVENDYVVLKKIWALIDEADILITHNGKKFDVKKLNARFLVHGFQPPTKFRHVDTYQIARGHFALTSNKLEYLAEVLNTKHKKLKHGMFPGFDLWKECLKGNKQAWDEMEKYNKHDVYTLEDVYNKLIPWDQTISYSSYTDDSQIVCTCGGIEFRHKGYHYTNIGKYKRYKCVGCGAETRGRDNLFSKEKKLNLRVKT